jgi:hypothetical protein
MTACKKSSHDDNDTNECSSRSSDNNADSRVGIGIVGSSHCVVDYMCRHECRHAHCHKQHTDPGLIVASKKTAERGIQVLSILLDNAITKRNCVAIYAASSGKQVNADADLVKVRTSNYQMETCQS